MLSLSAETIIRPRFICTPGTQWLLEKSESELPTEAVVKATRTGGTGQSSPLGSEERQRELGRDDVTSQGLVKGPSTSMSRGSERGVLSAIRFSSYPT